MSPHIEKAAILIQQSRYDLAEQQLSLELAKSPNSAEAHSLLALCLARREKFKDAIREAEAGIGLAPDSSYAHYVLAMVLKQADDLKRAETEVREALRIEPDDADYLALLGTLLYARKQFQSALEAIDQALAQDPKHVTALNLRSMALGKLNRVGEAKAGIDVALREDPDNAFTHSTRGWTELEHGDHREALDHFREALRLDPELETAREGLLAALKAKSVIYRLMLKYYFAMSRLSGKAQWAVLLGGYFGFRALRAAAKTNPGLAPFVWPVLVLYLVFVFLSWTSDSLFNLFLRLHPYGRYALSKDQVRATNWVGTCFFLAILSFVSWVATKATLLLPAAVFSATMIIPLSATFGIEKRKTRIMLGVYTGILATIGMAALGLFYFNQNLGATLAGAYLFGFFAFQWVANAVAIQR